MVFIYGPDSLTSRVRDRLAADVEVLGGATLTGWKLVFDKPNMKNKEEGLANLKEETGALTREDQDLLGVDVGHGDLSEGVAAASTRWE